MGYAKEFNHLEYNVPEFLLKDAAWEDVSWHNDVCPRWENYTMRLAIWVDCAEPECREYEEWKQYTVCEVLTHGGDDYYLADETLFSTEDANKLDKWLWLYSAKCHLEFASSAFCSMPEPIEELQDSIATILAQVEEAIAELQNQ